MARASRSKRSTEFLVAELDRDGAIEPGVTRPINFTHTAGSDSGQYFVWPETRSRR